MSFIKIEKFHSAKVKAFFSLRGGGFSKEPFDSFNLGLHTGDDAKVVMQNREKMLQILNLSQMPTFLNQVHSNKVVQLPLENDDRTADASFTNKEFTPCIVLTADCLPVLFANKQGTEIAAAHAGWRGLVAGILENTALQFSSNSEIQAFLAPAIGNKVFEVGAEVKEQFCDLDPSLAVAFQDLAKGKFLADIYLLAKLKLQKLGITEIFGGEHCTYLEKDKFFSYRRDRTTGRMASIIWIE